MTRKFVRAALALLMCLGVSHAYGQCRGKEREKPGAGKPAAGRAGGGAAERKPEARPGSAQPRQLDEDQKIEPPPDPAPVTEPRWRVQAPFVRCGFRRTGWRNVRCVHHQLLPLSQHKPAYECRALSIHSLWPKSCDRKHRHSVKHRIDVRLRQTCQSAFLRDHSRRDKTSSNSSVFQRRRESVARHMDAVR